METQGERWPFSSERQSRLWGRVVHGSLHGAQRSEEASSPARSTGARSMVRRTRGRWIQTGVPGVRFKLLWESECMSMRTVLYQMDAGATYRAHVHREVEECYVVYGDLQQAGASMAAGDYQRVERGSPHRVQSSLEGCLLLIRCSSKDRIDSG
jgi:anti-sigma factor ChrR (cupin superfamily)